jgi:hypothetical protein
VPFKFTETFAAATIELKEMKKADRDDATQARKAAALKKAGRSGERLPGGHKLSMRTPTKAPSAKPPQ